MKYIDQEYTKGYYTYYENTTSGGPGSRVRNMYFTLEGHIAPMPFDTKRDGLWRFDGQVWYL